MDVHGKVQLVPDDLLVLASKLVCTVDTLGVPVGPVKTVFKHGDGKRMWKTWQREKFTDIFSHCTLKCRFVLCKT